MQYICRLIIHEGASLQVLVFTLVAIGLYFFSDWLLVRIERRRGAPFKQRNIVFFIIMLSLTLMAFEVLQSWLRSLPG